MKLSTYAKNIGITYRTAWNLFNSGQIKGAYKLSSGTIIVPNEVDVKNECVAVYARVSSSENKANLISQSKRVFLFENTKRDLCHFEGSSFSSFNLSKKELIKSAVCRFFDTAISFQEVISSKPMAALKTLKRVPTELICRITATAKNDFNYQNKILVVSKLNEGNSLKEFLYVYKNQRSDYESSLTKFRFSWSWENLMSKDKYSLIIENYSELAEEFNGRLYILNEQNPQKLSHFGVACRSLSKDDLFE